MGCSTLTGGGTVVRAPGVKPDSGDASFAAGSWSLRPSPDATARIGVAVDRGESSIAFSPLFIKSGCRAAPLAPFEPAVIELPKSAPPIEASRGDTWLIGGRTIAPARGRGRSGMEMTLAASPGVTLASVAGGFVAVGSPEPATGDVAPIGGGKRGGVRESTSGALA